jgi:hypothetical protein
MLMLLQVGDFTMHSMKDVTVKKLFLLIYIHISNKISSTSSPVKFLYYENAVEKPIEAHSIQTD